MVPLTSKGLLDKLFLGALKEAIPIKLAACDKGRLELVMREDDKGYRYLFALNHNTAEEIETEVKVSGEYKNLFDLDCQMPVHSRSLAGMTAFSLNIHPGGGTIIYLGKNISNIEASRAGAKINLLDDRIRKAKKIAYAYRVKKEIKVDGSLDDWKGVKGTYLPSTQAIINKRAIGAKILDDKDISATFYNAWDDKNYYFAIDVIDDVLLHNKDPARVYMGDCVELFLDILNDATEDKASYGVKDLKFQFGINKVLTQATHGFSTVNRIHYDVKIRQGSYTLEVAIPLEELGLDESILSKGWTIGFDFVINDSDKEPMFTTADPYLLTSGMVILSWGGNTKAVSPFTWGKLTFVK